MGGIILIIWIQYVVESRFLPVFFWSAFLC